MKRLITLLALAVAFVATPALGLVAYETCPPCCDHAADSQGADGGPCTSLSMGTCCAAAPVVPVPSAKRMPDAPAAVSVAVAPATPAIAPSVALRGEAVQWWMQPSRFSVVRRL